MRAFAVGCVLFAAPALQAGIYSAAEPSGMRAGPDGRLVELPYVPAFKSFLEERFNAANPATPDRVNGINTFRGLLKQRVEAPPAGRLPVPQQVARAVDLVRIGRAADAVNLLEARTRDRDPDFVAVVTLPTPTPRRATGAKQCAATASPRSTPSRRRNSRGCCPS